MTAIARKTLRRPVECIRLPVLMAAPMAKHELKLNALFDPVRDYSGYESLAQDRFVSTRVKRIVPRVADRRISLLVRQAD